MALIQPPLLEAKDDDDEPQPDEAMVDTRALLLELYPDAPPPWSARVKTRLHAFRYHTRTSLLAASKATGFVRDATLIFLAWFFIACFENYRFGDGRLEDHKNTAQGLFYTMFELASAFGNVGLSLGSLKHPLYNVSFSADFCPASLLVMMLVQTGARIRELPARVDTSLTLPGVTAEDVLRSTVITRSGTAINFANTHLAAPPPPPDRARLLPTTPDATPHKPPRQNDDVERASATIV